MTAEIMRERCQCGCGLAPASTTRLRLCRCDACGCPTYYTRSWIERGACGTCGCGGSIVPACLEDRSRMPGPIGDEARVELMGRADEFGVRSERATKAAATRSRRANARKAPRARNENLRRDHTGLLVVADMPF